MEDLEKNLEELKGLIKELENGIEKGKESEIHIKEGKIIKCVGTKSGLIASAGTILYSLKSNNVITDEQIRELAEYTINYKEEK